MLRDFTRLLRLFTRSQLVPRLICEDTLQSVVSRSRWSSINDFLRDAGNSLRDNMNLR
jgi:hypothetical protein